MIIELFVLTVCNHEKQIILAWLWVICNYFFHPFQWMGVDLEIRCNYMWRIDRENGS